MRKKLIIMNQWLDLMGEGQKDRVTMVYRS